MTECYALQNTAFVAERLGVPTQAAKDLQAWLYERGYPNEPTEYQSPQCYDGGPLDLRPQQTLFPELLNLCRDVLDLAGDDVGADLHHLRDVGLRHLGADLADADTVVLEAERRCSRP